MYVQLATHEVTKSSKSQLKVVLPHHKDKLLKLEIMQPLHNNQECQGVAQEKLQAIEQPGCADRQAALMRSKVFLEIISVRHALRGTCSQMPEGALPGVPGL